MTATARIQAPAVIPMARSGATAGASARLDAVSPRAELRQRQARRRGQKGRGPQHRGRAQQK